jgi:hypothetical protein
MTLITVPDVDWSQFYYPDILRELLLQLRRKREEIGLTDENEYELHVQFMRALALVGHLNNCRADVIATELLITSSSLLESVKRLLRLIGVELASATPAKADVVLVLSEVTTLDLTEFIPELAEFSTDSVPPIPYEVLDEDGIDLDRTDQVSYVFGLEKVKAGVGQVDTGSPDIYERTSGDSFSVGVDEGSHLFIPAGLGSNGGEFRVVEVIDTDHVRVVRVPGSGSPSFQSEGSLNWVLMAFTVNYATEANTGSSFFSPWASLEVGDLLLLGHKQIQWDQIDLVLNTAGADFTGVWEYFDDRFSLFTPAADVTDNGSNLTADVTTLLGTPDRTGAEVKIEYIPTGVQETVVSTFSGGKNIITTQGLLGQTVIDIDKDNYRITAQWIPLNNVDDQTSNFQTDDMITFDHPQDDERGWQKAEVNLFEAEFLRYRVLTVGGGVVEPSIDRLRIDQDGQYLIVEVTQGETIGPQELGTSDGSASQEFELPDTPLLDDSELIEVDESGGGTWITYIGVTNFLNSTATSRHYIRETNADGKGKIRFGDGTNGKIPPATADIRGTYRIGGDEDGNVGVGQISVNADGIGGVGEVSNPRSATDWKQKDGATIDDLERVKRDSPAALRTRQTASNASDVLRLTLTKFRDRNDVNPVARAWAIEEGLGVKTIKLLVVGSGGRTLTAEEKSDLELYFNGDRNVVPIVEGVLMMNYKVFVFNYEPLITTVTTSVVWPGGNQQSIRNGLLNLLTPLSLEPDKLTYTWVFGGRIAFSRIHSEIHLVDPAIQSVSSLTVNGISPTPSISGITMGANQLPTSVSSGITINILESL